MRCKWDEGLPDDSLDATAADPSNVEAIFGLAETERMLKKNASRSV
jgi:hypothetical protein